MDSKTQIALLKEHLKTSIKKWNVRSDHLSLDTDVQSIVPLLTTLRDQWALSYTQLLDVCVVDYLGKAPKRFEVVYHLLSMDYNKRLRVKVPLDEDESISSVTSVFGSADWWEREAFDMFGVVFDGHPNLKRILTDYEFHGFPLRKDFPLTGYVQMRYDQELGKVVQEPVHLEQAFRTFDTISPWEGMDKAIERSQTTLSKDTQVVP